MVDLKSIIAFDCETTSMPYIDHNTTKIVELAFLGCEIKHLEESNKLPRVLHKLVLCFNPKKMIHPDASDTSGLTNELLYNLSSFSEDDTTMLKNFIKRLPEPVCIVAHNGYNFDFPILKRALDKLKVTLPNNVYCADSLTAFREILSETEGSGPMVKDFRSNDKNIERTPKVPKIECSNVLNYKSNYVVQKGMNVKPGVSRNLFPESLTLNDSFDESDKSSSPEYYRNNFPTVPRYSKKRFRMKDIYYFYHKTNFPNAHCAEEDAKALLSCIIKCHKFINWLKKNSRTFNSVEALF